MGVSEWLMLANIVVSFVVISIVGFGVYWLQNRKEDLRLKRDVFRRVVGNIHGILYDCRFFQESHSFSESGIVAINEVRATFPEKAVQNAWKRWHESNDKSDFVDLIHEMSIACKLEHYQDIDLENIADAFACSCITQQKRKETV